MEPNSNGNGKNKYPNDLLDAIISKYLESKGYIETTKKFNRTLDINHFGGSYHRSLVRVSRIESHGDLLSENTDSRDKDIPRQFSILKQYLQRNNELYRGELSQLLFPIFAHSYLLLLKHGKIGLAKVFFRKYQLEFSATEWKSEITDLSRLIGANFEECETAKSLLSSKIDLNISKDSFELVLRFFEDNNLFVFKSFANSCINFTFQNRREFSRTNSITVQRDIPSSFNFNRNSDSSETSKRGMKYSPSISLFTYVQTQPNDIKITRNFLVSGASNGSVQLHKFSNLNETIEGVGHSDAIFGVDYFGWKNAEFVISSSADTTIRLWNISSNIQQVFSGHQFVVWEVKSNPFRKNLFASGSHDKTARLWDINEKKSVRVFSGHLSDIDSLQFSSADGGSTLVSGSSDKTIKFWDIRSGKNVRIINVERGVTKIKFHPNACNCLVSGDEDGRISVWDGRNVKNRIFELFDSRSFGDSGITQFEFKNETCFSSALDSSINMWNFEKKKLMMKFHTKDTNVLDIKIIPDSNDRNKKNIVLAAGVFNEE